MTWYNAFGPTEYLLIFGFVGLYFLYVFRMIRIAKQLGSDFKNIFIKLVLRTVYFGLFVVALLGPSFGADRKEIKTVGKDIFFAVALSESMNAEDIAPSRLQKVKFELKNLIKAFSSDRMGIIIFSSEAFIQCPLTFDQSALNLFTETLNTGLVPSSGTDFAPPLKMALSKLNADTENPTQQKSKVVILISDGEDFGDESSDVAKEMASNGIRVFTLGVGTTEGSRIPTQRGYKRNKEDEVVITELKPEALKRIANITGGEYFELSNTNNNVSQLISTVNSIEGELRGTRSIDITANKYYYFLALAFSLLVLDLLVSIKTVKI